MKLKLMRALTWLALKGRLYYVWSRVYRWLWERSFRDIELPTFETMEELLHFASEIQWRRDTWIQLWDAVGDPRATYARHVTGMQKDWASDCDDISIFIADRMRNMIVEGKLKHVTEVGMLSCPWMKRDGKIGGHNVCAFEYTSSMPSTSEDRVELIRRWGHASNWDGARPSLGHASVRDLVQDVVSKGAGEGGKSLGWALCNTDLELRRYDGGKDIVG